MPYNTSTTRVAGAVIAAVAAATVMAVAAWPVAAEPAPPSDVVETAGPSGDAGPPGRLVAYTGPQVGRLSTAWIPQGWVVQGGDAGSLTLAPADAPDQDPSSYDNKIVVLLETDAALAEPNAQVDGRPAVLVPDERHHRYGHVYVPFDGGAVHVQVPPTSPGRWSDDDLLRLAAGIAVGRGAEITAG